MPHSPIYQDFQDFRVFQQEPNLTAVLPGSCPARCPFCVEPEHKLQASPKVWLESFGRLLEELPLLFGYVTISGGEPSLSPIFPDVLALLEPHRVSGRLKRVVLTTNGCTRPLTQQMSRIGKAVTHVNISRHAVDDEVNAGIFKTDSVPWTEGLRDLITQLNQAGLPVNLNCVHSSKHVFGRKLQHFSLGELRAETLRYIDFAKWVGASSVVFRSDHRENRLDEEIELESVFSDHAIAHEARCASCRVVGKFIHGLPINFKRSLYEPSRTHMETELYELVFHSDGSLCRDWARQHSLRRPLPHAWPSGWEKDLPQPLPGTWGNSSPECKEEVPGCGLLTFARPRED